MKKIKTLLLLLLILVSAISCSKSSPQISDDTPPMIKQEKWIYYNEELNKINPKQAWESFKKEYGLPGEMKAGGAGINWNEERGIPKYVVGFKSRKYSGSPQEIATNFLQEHGNIFELKNNSLYFVEILKSGEENRVIYEQRYQNIPVYGTNVQVLVTPDKRVRQLSIDYYPNIKLTEVQSKSAEAAEFKKVVHDVLINKGFSEGQELDAFLDSRKPEKFIYPFKERSNINFYSTLLYRLPNMRLFLDAKTAKIVNVENLN